MKVTMSGGTFATARMSYSSALIFCDLSISNPDQFQIATTPKEVKHSYALNPGLKGSGLDKRQIVPSLLLSPPPIPIFLLLCC